MMIRAIRAMGVWRYRRKAKKAIAIVRELNNIMKLAGYSRSARRQVWHDFSKEYKLKMGPS